MNKKIALLLSFVVLSSVLYHPTAKADYSATYDLSNVNPIASIMVATGESVLIFDSGTGPYHAETYAMQINMANNSAVTLEDVKIDNSSSVPFSYPICVLANASASVMLLGESSLRGNTYCPGILVPSGSTLTVLGTGKLTANGGDGAAGIGGGYKSSIGNIIITGDARVNANGGSTGAGIGTSFESASAAPYNISISGKAKVNAQGGVLGAGIGNGRATQSGYNYNRGCQGQCEWRFYRSRDRNQF